MRNPFKRRIKVDIKTLDHAIRYLETASQIMYDPREAYPDEVMAALGLMEPDYQYAVHLEKAKEIPIDSMPPDMIRAKLTSYLRGERFCDGYIAEIVNSGELLSVLRRLKELTGT